MVKERKKTKVRSKCKEKPKAKKIVPPKSKVDIVGDRINRKYRSAMRQYYKALKEDFKDIPVEGDDTVYLYVTVDRESQDVTFDDVSTPDYYRGASPSRYWLAAIPVDRDTTKKELMEVDLAEETHYYDDIDMFGN